MESDANSVFLRIINMSICGNTNALCLHVILTSTSVFSLQVKKQMFS